MSINDLGLLPEDTYNMRTARAAPGRVPGHASGGCQNPRQPSPAAAHLPRATDRGCAPRNMLERTASLSVSLALNAPRCGRYSSLVCIRWRACRLDSTAIQRSVHPLEPLLGSLGAEGYRVYDLRAWNGVVQLGRVRVWSNYVANVSNGGQFPLAAAFAPACNIGDRY